MTARVEVDDSRCMGTGNCELVAPAAFRVGDDSVAQVLETPNDTTAIERAIAECPAGAIRLLQESPS